jgi:hypothetical protein
MRVTYSPNKISSTIDHWVQANKQRFQKALA